MPDTIKRQSPIHNWMEARQSQWPQFEWSQIGAMRVAARVDSDDVERAALATLGLCDATGPIKLGLKGPGSEAWLKGQGLDLPAAIYETRRLADGGLIVRLSTDEFLLESGVENQTVAPLVTSLGAQHDVWGVEQQDTTFFLVGPRAIDVLAQTCGVNFRQAARQRLVLTRVAGVSCGVLPETINPDEKDPIPVFRLWTDPGLALYLWEQLVEIGDDLGGRVIGVRRLFPQLQ